VAFVVDVEAVIDGVILELGHVARQVDHCHGRQRIDLSVPYVMTGRPIE
jgi:hypothetical protein